MISEWDAKDIELVTADEKEKITHYVSSYEKLKEKLKAICDATRKSKAQVIRDGIDQQYAKIKK